MQHFKHNKQSVTVFSLQKFLKISTKINERKATTSNVL